LQLGNVSNPAHASVKESSSSSQPNFDYSSVGGDAVPIGTASSGSRNTGGEDSSISSFPNTGRLQMAPGRAPSEKNKGGWRPFKGKDREP
jgi:hypothetical protein